MLVLAAMACGLPGGLDIGGDAGEAGDTGDGSGDGGDGGDSDFIAEDLDALDSYRLEMTWRVESEDGSESYEMIFVEEWTRDPPARHLMMSGSETGAETTPFTEIITIEDTTWVRMGDTWMEMPAPEGAWMSDAWEGFFADVDDWNYEGSETVNGVNCRHYISGGETTFTVPDPETGGTATIDAEAEIWVADESGLPSVVVRQRARIEGGFIPLPTAGVPADGGGTVYLESDLTSINEPISIQPPEDVTDF
jgi:hypothetical protein